MTFAITNRSTASLAARRHGSQNLRPKENGCRRNCRMRRIRIFFDGPYCFSLEKYSLRWPNAAFSAARRAKGTTMAGAMFIVMLLRSGASALRCS